MKKLIQHGNFKPAVSHLTTLHWTEPGSQQTTPTECCSLSDTLHVQGGITQTKNPQEIKKIGEEIRHISGCQSLMRFIHKNVANI